MIDILFKNGVHLENEAKQNDDAIIYSLNRCVFLLPLWLFQQYLTAYFFK